MAQGSQAGPAPVAEGSVAGSADPLLPAPTRRVLFGPLTSTDVSGAVVRRLRAAIGLGLLADGDRLPREADLAAQLGITTFSLREALGELRHQGLLVTRAGKYGGSFVTHPPASEELERGELLRLTSAELRDLGDWRQMLAAHSAVLAAHRASETNHERLEAFARQVGEASTSQQARRAHGRFHVEMASAAQSLRMTRAEFGVHEEIDWLFGLALLTDEQREVSANGLLDITRAVANHDPDAARAAAERYSARLVGALARLRLDVLASRHDEHGAAATSTLQDEIGTFTSTILDQLTAIAADVAPLFVTAATERELRSGVALAILQRIGSLPRFVDEVGVLAEVGVVPDHRYWTEAWLRTESGPREDDSHVMDPTREDFYDYESREFIAQPRLKRKAWATGPYVDYGGADDYIVTVSAPIVVDDTFLGIASADFLVADLERLFAPWLATPDLVCVLINSENRVIVSNSVAHSAGDVMVERHGYELNTFPMFGWSLLTKPFVRE